MEVKDCTLEHFFHVCSTLVHWHHSKVYEKLANDLEIVPCVLMTMTAEGHGEVRYY